MITEEYILILRCFTWDSDQYETHSIPVSFATLDIAREVYDGILRLPKPNWDMPYFGEFKDIQAVRQLLAGYGNNDIYFDGGGVSTSIECRFVKTETEEIAL